MTNNILDTTGGFLANTAKVGRALGAAVKFCFPIAIFLLVWQASAVSGVINPLLLPSPSAIFANIGRLLVPDHGQPSILIQHVLVSLWRVIAGYGAAAVLCTIIGILMGVNKRIYSFFDPIITIFMPIPAMAWVPIIILWLGMSNATIMVVIFISCLFPIIYNTAAGVRRISYKHLWAARIMGASRSRIFLKVLLPGALPGIITGHILAFSNGWRALVGSEMLAGAGFGIGYMIFDARTFMDTETVYAGMMIIALLGVIIEKGVFRSLQRFTIERWGVVAR